MISMAKKYRCRDGVPVTVLTNNIRGEYPIVVVRHESTVDRVYIIGADGKMKSSENNIFDLIEIGPYEDFKINDPVMVSDNGRREWVKRYFAGVDEQGGALAFPDGCTSWSTRAAPPVLWDFCRRPTSEELKE